MRYVRIPESINTFVFCTHFVRAQEDSIITIRKTGALNVFIKPFAAPDTANGGIVISNDLEQCGLF